MCHWDTAWCLCAIPSLQHTQRTEAQVSPQYCINVRPDMEKKNVSRLLSNERWRIQKDNAGWCLCSIISQWGSLSASTGEPTHTRFSRTRVHTNPQQLKRPRNTSRQGEDIKKIKINGSQESKASDDSAFFQCNLTALPCVIPTRFERPCQVNLTGEGELAWINHLPCYCYLPQCN